MAINQPPITGDQVMDAWLLEVTREINSGQSRSNLTEANVRSISVITNNSSVEDWALKANADEDVPDEKIPDTIARDAEAFIKSVNSPLSVDTATGRLSISQTAFDNNLVSRNLFFIVDDSMVGDVTITFNQATGTPPVQFIPEIFDTHFVFLGGLKLVESQDYNTHLTDDQILVKNQITLSSAIVSQMVGLRLELSNWSA